MKAGLFTYHFSDNYGALYQAYGLRQWLRKRGVDAEFVNYHPTYVEEGGPLDRPWNPALWRKNATIMYMQLSHQRRRLFGDKAQHAAFEDFRAKVLGVSGKRLYSVKDLRPAMAKYDLLVCGSDQIWNPSIQRGLDPAYFLDIPGAEHCHKVAFAPSFGRTSIEAEFYPQLRGHLLALDAVSVREASGLDIIRDAGADASAASVVPDPTILLGGFDELLGEAPERDNSVFCYALRTDETIRDVAETAAKHVGGPLYAPRSSRQRWRDIGEGIIPGPVDWLRRLNAASVVVSNSFHGIALSIVLNRPFIAVALPGKRTSLNARAQNLLDLTGLSNRMVQEFSNDRVHKLAQTPIDWTMVNARLEEARIAGEHFLDVQIDRVKSAMNSHPRSGGAA